MSGDATPTVTSPASPPTWVVERLDINGEELPIIRHSETWLPAPIALRYVLRMRFRLGPASLTSAMRGVAVIYNWAETVEEIGNLEEFIKSGNILTREHLMRLMTYLRQRHCEIFDKATASSGKQVSALVSNRTFNSRLFAAGQFLEWAIEPSEHGGAAIFDEDEREARRQKLMRLLKDQRLPTGGSERQEPLTDDEILLIRRAIAPDEFGDFPPDVFDKATRYRNWIMFETCLGLGTRRGEMLTLKVEHLPADTSDKRIYVPRQQDAEEDPRKRRRLRGKTNERLVPLADPSVLASILRYRDARPPVGRNDPRFTSPYLFLTETGSPVSNSTADRIIANIGRYAARLLDADQALNAHTRKLRKESMLTLTWHRLRHTWAEQAALTLYGEHGDGAWAILMEFGGWNSEDSMARYTQYAKRAISDRASRRYQSSLSFRRTI